MKPTLSIAALVLLSGCTSFVPQVAGNIASFQYCSEVTYTRRGNEITISAKCNAPIGGSSVPVPVPPSL